MSEENSTEPEGDGGQTRAQAAPDLAATIQALSEMPMYVVIGIDQQGQPMVVPQLPPPEDRGVVEMSVISSMMHYLGRAIVNDTFPRAEPTAEPTESGAVGQEAPAEGEGDDGG